MIEKSVYSLIRKSFIFVAPVFIIVIIMLAADPFRVFFSYEDYYKGNFVTHSRGIVCFKLFEKNRKKITYNSFIFGSSRSWAFRIVDWLRYLPDGSVGYHFDASAEGVFGVYNKLKYLDATGIKIKNALVVVDESLLMVTSNKKEALFISPYQLSSESLIEFYSVMLKQSLEPGFVMAYLDYKAFNKYSPYMKKYFNEMKYASSSDNKTGDLYFAFDRMSKEEIALYYDEQIRSGLFYKRSSANTESDLPKSAEVFYLNEIKNIFSKHKTKYKIIISPLYNQIPLDREQLSLLNTVFGKLNVYNFSGVNK